MSNPMDLIVGEAFRAFDRWCREHDPEGNMDVLAATVAYSEWADKNSVERYMDAAQPVRGVEHSADHREKE